MVKTGKFSFAKPIRLDLELDGSKPNKMTANRPVTVHS